MKAPRKDRDGEVGPEPRTMDDDPVVQGILKAITQKRLKPGTKLGEDALAQVFSTTRIHIRQVLGHLVSRHIVTHYPNRGAFIYRPSVQEARDIFAARRMLETATLSAVIDNLDDDARGRLRRHIARETGHDRNDRWASLTLTADFHVLIAELAGNGVLLDFAKELMLRTSLAIATFEVPGSPDCSPDAHPGIADLILAGDKAGALAAMNRHLDEIELRLQLGSSAPDPDDIVAIFQDIGVVPVNRSAG
ncbi:GntR family transcriptional regulator [Vineibacter terrae]|uniref:GntR family transcriptional regulator n=3 Tax=Vineibacter terrae TaxID=2586908 RepID=A0A5C8P9P5_9HYPH|nr:GntR family transcriptional regulator [Vineibacter terrae]